MKYIKLLTALALLCVAGFAKAQFSTQYGKEGLKIYLSNDSSQWIKGTGLAQIWLRYNSNNPNSTVFGTPKSDSYDAGLRRVRYQTMAQLTKKAFFYTQFGINNVNSISARKPAMFFHDVTAEYAIYKNYFTIGAGLSGWNGTARFSSSSVASIMGMDLPYVEEGTNDVSDQFVRRMGMFVKGKISGFDYRVSVANPYPVQTATTMPGTSVNQPVYSAASPANTAYFSTRAPELIYQGYFMWQFLDKESNQTPYMNGSYLGKKRIFNIGGGFAYQKNAMVYRNGDTPADSTRKYKPLQQFGADVFYDSYLDKEKQNAITAYAAYLRYDFGPNYIRNSGPMNTANGVNTIGTTANFNGAGNAFPLTGTGHVIYAQAAYLFKKDLLGSQGTLQPYAQLIYADYDKLKDPMNVYNLGINWIIAGQNSKITMDYQSRPVYNTEANGDVSEVKSARRGQIVLQYQVTF